MEYDVIDEVANRLDKLEILHHELSSEHQLLFGTTEEIATSVRKDLEELLETTRNQKDAISEMKSELFYIDLQQSQLAQSFELHRVQTYRILQMQENCKRQAR